MPKNAVLIPEEAKKVFEGQIFDVYQWPQTMFDGSSYTFEMLKRPDTVIVISLVGDDILVLKEQQPHSGLSLSFPGGRVDKTDEDVVSAARREILEETGYEFSNWRLVKVVQPHKKIEWFIYYYLAWDADKQTEPKLDAGEKIVVQKLAFEEVKKQVLNKAGYLAEAHGIFENLETIDQLLNLPEFEGREVDDKKVK